MTASPTELLVPLSLLQPSTTNPRKRIDTEALAALAESVAEHEVMQPVLARPHPAPVAGGATLEIVAGERRWRACDLLGERNPHKLPGAEGMVPAIPCLVRDLTDAQVLAMQLVENIARVDLHPLEEALHYQRMRQDPKAPARVEDIAHLAKVSESRVYERLSLLHMVPLAREAFLAEKLSLKTALLVARMPATEQPEIVRNLSDWGGEPMSPKAAARFIRENFLLRLTSAPFPLNDTELVPEAGACGTCPKRSGANPELFADVSEHDTCTDRACFERKRTAQHARLLEELRATGYRMLEGEAARAACTPDGRDLKPGLVSLEASVPASIGDPGTRVAEVLERAKVPPSDVHAIAHPLVSYITLAVPTGRLEDALRRLHAHRDQQQPPATSPAPKNAPTPSAPPAPPAVAQSAAKAAQTLAAPAPWPFPGERESRAGEAQLHDHWPAPDSPRARLMDEALAFEPPAHYFAGKNTKFLASFGEEQTARARAIIAAVLAGGAVTARHAVLSREALVRMLLLSIFDSGATWLRFNGACDLAGVPVPAALRTPEAGAADGKHVERLQWLWKLPPAEAERLCTVLCAAQEGDASGNPASPTCQLPEFVLADLRIDASQVQERAKASVDEIIRVAALQHGAAAPTAPKKQAAPRKASQA